MKQLLKFLRFLIEKEIEITRRQMEQAERIPNPMRVI